MTITLNPDIAAALTERAKEKGISPEDLIETTLREQLALRIAETEPGDDWEKLIIEIGADCGVSLPDAALSSESLYE